VIDWSVRLASSVRDLRHHHPPIAGLGWAKTNSLLLENAHGSGFGYCILFFLTLQRRDALPVKTTLMEMDNAD